MSYIFYFFKSYKNIRVDFNDTSMLNENFTGKI